MTEKRNYGALVVGVILISLGALSLLEKLFEGTSFWGWMWPFIIIGFGAMFFVGMFLFGKEFAWMAIPGSIISANGLMLFLQNLTHRWETWSYSWTIILISVGLGIYIMGAYQGVVSRKRAGKKVMEIGFILFVIFGAFFEILFSFGVPDGWRSYVFPVGLLVLGFYLVFKRSGLSSSREKAVQDQPGQVQSIQDQPDVVVPPPNPDAE